MKADELWSRFCSAAGREIQDTYEAWAFGDAPNHLAALVIEGVKTGTASAYDLYLDDPEEPLPKAGDYSVILDENEEALCIIQTTETAVVPFDEVSSEHARSEGEGDRSLSYWRSVHEAFFRDELQGTEHQFHSKLPVLTERFALLYSLFEVRQMTEKEAREVCTWKYPAEFAEYDLPTWEECCAKGWALTDAEKRENSYFSVFYEGRLFGFFHIMDREDHIELGVGMHPEQCGKHLGKIFMELALAKIEVLHYGLPVLLSVRIFNQRAIRCYRSVGFEIIKQYVENSHHAAGEMYLMALRR